MYPDRSPRPPRQDIYVPPRRPVQQSPAPQPVPEQQPASVHRDNFDHPQYGQKKGNGFLKVVLIFVIIGLIGGAGYGGYYYATNIKSKKSSVQSASNQQAVSTDNSSVSLSNQSSVNDPVHFVSSASSPYDLGGKKTFTVSLGLPSIAQGIRTTSYNNNRGQEQYYTDRYADEIARFDIGYPDIPQPTQSQVSVLAISKSWLALKQNGNHAFDDTAVSLDTPAQKASYIAKISKDSQSCITDKAKGFTTKDKVFNVCFSLIPGLGDFTPVLVLHGYGEQQGQPLLMVGFIHLRDGKNYDKKTSEQILADAKKGKLPDSTVKLIDTFVMAFSETTFKVQ